MGSGDTESCAYILRTVTAFYSNGASAGRFEVVQRGSYQYARKEGGTQESILLWIIKMDSTMYSGMEHHGYIFTNL